jgi:hypothetical protein
MAPPSLFASADKGAFAHNQPCSRRVLTRDRQFKRRSAAPRFQVRSRARPPFRERTTLSARVFAGLLLAVSAYMLWLALQYHLIGFSGDY